MKTPTRIQRRRKSQPRDGSFFRKENNKEQNFFSDSVSESFFQSKAAVQRKCDKCDEDEKKPDSKQKEEDDKKVQAKEAPSSASGNTSIAGAGSSYISSLSGGSALSGNANQFFANRLGHDFGNVKIHTGEEAEQSAKQINAQAYTYGNHIVFAKGKYQPETEEGKRLLAHELTHVIQQQGIQRKIQMSPEEEGRETENTNEIIDESPEKEQEAEENEQVSTEPVSLPSFTVFGQPASDTVFANSVRFTGETKADFDGGVGQTKDLQAIPAKKCSGCAESDCVTITGTLDVTYTVTTSVMLPDVPEGLTPCQHQRVKDAIDNKIAPHEQQHVEAYQSYNGTSSIPINYTGCKDGIQAYVQKLTDTDSFARKTSATAKSKLLDPFFVNVDLDCKEPEPPKK